jgi:hypothetical protein
MGMDHQSRQTYAELDGRGIVSVLSRTMSVPALVPAKVFSLPISTRFVHILAMTVLTLVLTNDDAYSPILCIGFTGRLSLLLWPTGITV